jgi:hypothetical protein
MRWVGDSGNKHHRHWIGGVGSHWLPRYAIDHLFSIAMIGGDKNHAAGRQRRRYDLAQTLIDGFDRTHRR